MKIDLSGVETTSAPIPEGVYKIDIVDAEIRETKNGLGTAVNLQMQVHLPDGTPRTHYDFILFRHESSDIAQRIGQERLRSLSDALGLDASDFDPSATVGKSCRVKLKISTKEPDRNEVRGYLAPEGEGATESTGEEAPAPAVAAANSGNSGAARPWTQGASQ